MTSPKELIKLKEKEIEKFKLYPFTITNILKGELKALKQMNELWLKRIDEEIKSLRGNYPADMVAQETADALEKLKDLEGTKNEQ